MAGELRDVPTGYTYYEQTRTRSFSAMDNARIHPTQHEETIMDKAMIDRMIAARFDANNDATVVHIGADGAAQQQSETFRYGRPAVTGKTEVIAQEKADQLARHPGYTLYSEGFGVLPRPVGASAVKTETGGYVSIATTANVTAAALEGFLCALAVRSGLAAQAHVLDALAVAADQTRTEYDTWLNHAL